MAVLLSAGEELSMGYFPLFVDLEGAGCLVVGGGSVAERKVEKLLPYGPNILVVAPVIIDGLRSMRGIRCEERLFTDGDVDSMSLVVAASDDRELNSHISRLCKERGIPVNVVDCPNECTFLFPSLIKEGELSIGISTGGASPTAAQFLKEKIRDVIPGNIAPCLEILDRTRPQVKEAVKDEQTRANMYRHLFYYVLRQGKNITYEKVLDEIMRLERNWKDGR